MRKLRKRSPRVFGMAVATSFLLTTVGSITSGLQVQAANGPSSGFSYVVIMDETTSEESVIYNTGQVNNEALAGATYDSASNTLTLNNFSNDHASVVANAMGDDFKIKAEGNNSIGRIYTYGDGQGGSVTVTGTGTLNVNENAGLECAVEMMAEDSYTSFTVDKTVNVKLHAQKDVIAIWGSKITDAGSAVVLKNGQSVSVGAEEYTYETAADRVPGLLFSDDPTSYYLCQKDNTLYYYSSSSSGYYVSANTVLYDEASGTYFQDSTSSSSAFNTQVDHETFEAEYTVVTSEKVPVYYAYANSYGYAVSKDANGNRYVVSSMYMDGETTYSAYTIGSQVTLSDGNSYTLLFKDTSVDSAAAEAMVEEKTTVHTGTYNYTVEKTELTIEAKADADDDDSDDNSGSDSSNSSSDDNSGSDSSNSSSDDNSGSDSSNSSSGDNSGSDSSSSNSGSSSNTGSSDSKSDSSSSNSSSDNNSRNGSSSDDSDTESVVTAGGTTIESNMEVTNTSAVSVAVTTAQNTVNTAAGLSSGQYAEVKIDGNVTDGARTVVTNVASATGAKVADVMEITINTFTNNGAPVGNVAELSAPIELTVQAPDDVDGNTYDFAVVRLHNGETTILPDLDEDPSTITFQTDRFSTYAVIYGEKGSFDAYKTMATGIKKALASPKTGEETSVLLAVLMVMTAVLAAGCVRRKNRF